MLEKVVVKTVGETTIYLKDVERWPGWAIVTTFIFGFAGTSVVAYGYMRKFDLETVLIGYSFFGISLCIFICTEIFWKYPSLNVWTETAGDGNYVVIRKTTPEADQIAVCKAVKKIEDNLLAKIKEQEDLAAIAAKCR